MQKSQSALQGLYLTFTLNQQTFGMSIEAVREINQLPEITPVPNTPVCVAGVINLRGKVVPVVDLRRKFNLHQKGFSRDTCVIIVEGHQGQVAAIVDSVASVVNFTRENIEIPPTLIQDASSDAILGLGKAGQEVVILLDIARAVDTDQIHSITALPGTENPRVA